MTIRPRFLTGIMFLGCGFLGADVLPAQDYGSVRQPPPTSTVVSLSDAVIKTNGYEPAPSYFDSPSGTHPVIDEATNLDINCVPCKPDKPAAGPTPYKTLFYDNDYSYLKGGPDACGTLGDGLKQNNFFGIGCLDVGGQYRLRGHWEQNMRGLGLTGVDDQFLLHRTRLFANLKMGDNFRVFAEMIDAESNYENFNPRPIEVNRADMLNLFVDARLMANEYGDVNARVGRQEILLGSQRVITPLDWANTRRTYEGARVTWKADNLTVDGFWFNPMNFRPKSFDSPNRDQEWWGIYTSLGGSTGQNLDGYFLKLRNGVAGFDFSTFGARWHGDNDGNLWDFEGGYQFGDNSNGSNHASGAATFGVGKKLQSTCWEPTLWFFYDWASGDQALGQGNGYHHQFPLAHKYLGFMDLFGRRNIEDLNLLFTAKPAENLKLLVWYHYFFLETQSDSPYNVNMTAFNGANAPGSAELGHEIDFLVDYSISKRQKLVAGYSHFFAGSYYTSTAGVPYTRDADFFYTQWSIDF